MKNLSSAFLCVLIVFVMLRPINAQEILQNDGGGKNKSIGLTLETEFASNYINRGLNVFQGDSHLDQHMAYMFLVNYVISNTGVTLEYFAAYQILGDNLQSNIDSGIGPEQNLAVYYDIGLTKKLFLNFYLNWLLYPFASEFSAGTKVPLFLEPAAGLSFSSFFEFSLRFLYSLGIQSAVRDFSYLYMNPKVSKAFSISELCDLSLSTEFGYKLYKNRDLNTDNVWSTKAGGSLNYHPRDWFYLEPRLYFVWTNFDDRGFSDEIALYYGLAMGFNL